MCLNYVEHLLFLASTITGCNSISAFTSLVCVSVGIASSAVGLKICAMTAGIKKHKSITQKKEKYDKIVLLGKTKLDTIEMLISNALSDSYISHNEFVSVNNEMKEEIKILWDILIYYIYIYIYIYIYMCVCMYMVETYCVSWKKNTANKNSSSRKVK